MGRHKKTVPNTPDALLKLQEVSHQYASVQNLREQIKIRQKKEMDDLLAPSLIDLGKSIIAARNAGFREVDIENFIESRNRSVLYQAINMAKQATVTATPTSTDTVYYSWDVTSNPYEYTVTIVNHATDETRTYVIDRGLDDIPNEWLTETNTELKKVYKDIVDRLSDV